jgi:hypothetical protein
MDPTAFGKCPGQDRNAPAAPELFICPICGGNVEIWTDETKRTCPKCKTQVMRDAARKAE